MRSCAALHTNHLNMSVAVRWTSALVLALALGFACGTPDEMPTEAAGMHPLVMSASQVRHLLGSASDCPTAWPAGSEVGGDGVYCLRTLLRPCEPRYRHSRHFIPVHPCPLSGQTGHAPCTPCRAEQPPSHQISSLFTHSTQLARPHLPPPSRSSSLQGPPPALLRSLCLCTTSGTRSTPARASPAAALVMRWLRFWAMLQLPGEYTRAAVL